jgi:hypothetical protein
MLPNEVEGIIYVVLQVIYMVLTHQLGLTLNGTKFCHEPYVAWYRTGQVWRTSSGQPPDKFHVLNLSPSCPKIKVVPELSRFMKELVSFVLGAPELSKKQTCSQVVHLGQLFGQVSS